MKSNLQNRYALNIFSESIESDPHGFCFPLFVLNQGRNEMCIVLNLLRITFSNILLPLMIILVHSQPCIVG
jgi:hypothetical protein